MHLESLTILELIQNKGEHIVTQLPLLFKESWQQRVLELWDWTSPGLPLLSPDKEERAGLQLCKQTERHAGRIVTVGEPRWNNGAAKETAETLYPQIPNSALREGRKNGAQKHSSLSFHRLKKKNNARGEIFYSVIQIQGEGRDRTASEICNQCSISKPRGINPSGRRNQQKQDESHFKHHLAATFTK